MILPIHNKFKGTNMLFNKLNTCTKTNDIYTNNGTYKLTCETCDKAYIDQTGRSLRAKFSRQNRYEYSHPR
jgi:transposase-like protein